MKSIIYFNNSKFDNLLLNNLKKNYNKLSKTLDKNKIFDVYNVSINKLINLYNNNYSITLTINITKLLSSIIILLCNQYKQNNNKIPHIIISYYENNNIINIFKQLEKSKIIELSIITNINILDGIRSLKKDNTYLCFISNINNNYIYNLKKIQAICKYFNILLFSYVENVLSIYSDMTNNYISNQDIIIFQYTTHKLYYIFIKQQLLLKYKNIKLVIDNNSLNNNIMLYGIVNIIDIIKYNDLFNKHLDIIKNSYNLILQAIKSKYRFLNYSDFIKFTNKKYFYNTSTLILLNKDNIKELNSHNMIYNLYNKLIFSLYIPNIKYTNTFLFNYFKSKNIILNSINFNKYYDNLSNDIKKGIICLELSYLNKIEEINKFIVTLDLLIEVILKSTFAKVSNKKKKSVRFSTPEYIILNKPFKSSKINNKKNKSILKK